jgi:ribosomal protein S24E
MEMKNLEEKKNPFLNRTEYTIELKTESAPSEDEIKEALGKDKELTVVRKINSNFGRQTFVVDAIVYDDLESKEKIQTIPQKVRKKMEEEKKKEAEEAAKKAEEEKKAAEEAEKAAEEAAVEEVKEEVIEEEKEEAVEEPKEETAEEKPEEKKDGD